MAEDLTINIKSNLEDLKTKASKVNLSPEQAENVNKGLSAAQKAFDAKDWDTFRIEVNKVSKVLNTALAATSNISEALRSAINLKNTVEQTINNARDKLSAIRSKYTDNSLSKLNTQGAKQIYDEWTSKNGDIKSDKGQSLGREEALRRFTEALELAGGKIVKVTDEMARQAHLSGRGDVFALNRYAKYEETAKAADIQAARQAEQEIAKGESQLPSLENEIERLSKASEQSADSVADLYKEIVRLTSALNQDVVTQKGEERQQGAKDSGAAPSLEELKATNTELNKQSTSLGKAFKQFSIYAIALRTVKKALSEASRTIKELDKYLTEQAMVTGKTRQQTYALLKDYQQMASDLGATTKEVAEVSTQFMRQGKTTKDALTLTRAAISAAKVAGISTAESVDYLTTAVNGFRLSAQDAMRVSDKFAALAASAAVSYEEVATALSKVAAQANLAGMSIDYTTALLTKGIETTREPAESIGTALKTIVARMREITDYGKTLEDGMDLNNVEKQLRYVDIALRDQNGELRSTEDVLNDLGMKWDTLSQNQQAAVAKALAGTRQQSRLIAMMQDYDRVIELQQIAARSAGATSAQAAVYMEGMEAALNKINVAWERIVSAVTNSDIIIGFLEAVSNAMEHLGAFLESSEGIVITMTTIAALGLTIVGRKMMEMQLSKQQQKVVIMQQKAELDKQKAEAMSYKLNQKMSTEELKQLVIEQKQTVAKKQQLVDELKLKKANGDNVDNALREAELSLQTAQSDLAQYETELAKAEAADYTLKTYDQQNTLLKSQGGLLDQMSSGLSMMIAPLMTIWGLYKSISTAINGVIAKKKAEELQTKKNTIANTAEAGTSMAGSAGKIPYVGWIIAAGILIAMGIAAGAAILALTSKMNNTGANKAADDINKLSNEIYKLTEKANAIKSITKQYDALDNKIIKTNEDLKEMSELLDKAADKLDDEEKKAYEHLSNDVQRRRYLTALERSATSEANAKRREQIRKVRNLSSSERAKLLNSNTTNADYLEAQSAIYAINNNTLYSYIDSLDKVNAGVEKFTQSILENLSAQEAWAYANDESGTMIKRLTDIINNSTTWTSSGEETTYAAIINSDDYTLRERINAYDQLHDSIQSLGDTSLLRSFEQAYQQWEHLKLFSTEALDYIERLGLSIDEINDFSAALQKLGYTAEESANKLNALFNSLENGEDLTRAILSTFNEVLSQFEYGSKQWVNAYNRILNGFQATTGVTLTNIGQGITSLQSRISKFYEIASKWATLSQQERTEFMQENDAMFRGESGAALARAFETGNYNLIQEALGNNEGLRESIRLQLQELEIALQIAEARKAAGEENEFEIKYLKEQIALLEDYQNAESEIYRADLKLRLDQEKAQLDLYKDYLQKQKEALEDSLDKRKEAYHK